MADILDRLKTALADRYQIERGLGSGGMATVYLAQDLKHERKVAVKVLRPELAAALGPERFHQEIKIAANLTHPHILPLHDSGDADGFLYYVMPHIEGQSLRDKLAHERELPIGEAVRILRDVVDALSHAHKQRVVHRDIKPDNVLLSERHALVTDFGVAKAVSEATGAQKLTTEGVALGTPAYMSPEQAAADKHIDHRADIYAVGALAYELLTGRPPFTGTTPQEVLSAQVTQPPDPVTKYRAMVPPALAQVIMRCLEKKAADRWQTAEELLPQLEALATASGGMTPTAPAPVRTVQALARRTLIRAGTLLGMLLAAAVGWWLLLGRGGAPAASGDKRIPIAGLVFDSHGAGEDDAFIGERIAEDINTQLSKVSGFEVKAHASARQLSRSTLDYGEMSTRLGAEYLVHGTVRAVADSVRITVRLIDPETEGTRWAEDYTREFTAANLFGVTRDVAEQVANDLRLALSAQEQEQLAATPTEDTRAYRLYLEGRYFWNQRTTEALSRSVGLFSQAVERDPQFALVHAGLADAHSMLRSYRGLSANQAMPLARAAALRALEIDSTLAEAYTSLAWVLGTYEYDWSTAEQHFGRAIGLKRDYATAHQWYGWHLASLGRLHAARDAFERAIELDPLSLIVNTDYGWNLYTLQEYDAAIAQLSRVLELDPDFVQAHYRFYESDCRGHTSSSLIAERSCPGQSAPTAAGTRLGGLCGSLGQSSYCASFHLDSTRDPTGRWEAICTRALRTTVLSETRHAAGLTLLRVLRRGLELGECLG